MQYGVIMAGGSGTRLWPLSRADQPKQLLPIVRGKSLLQLSYERFAGLIPPERIYVCTGAAYRDIVLQNLPQLPKENLLGEPIGRDTTNAVGFPAAVLIQKDKDATICVTTADHVIEPIEVFQNTVKTAFAVTEKFPNALVTFGIVPTHGHIGLGYIERGSALAGFDAAYKVQAFKEKPDKETADRYVESGRYYWNSGMFVWRAQTVLDEIAAHLPESYAGLTKIGAAWHTPQREEVLNSVYPKLPKISVDYAIMEPASQGKGKAQVVTVETPIQWLDIGSWPALAEILALDENSNAIDAEFVVTIDSQDNIIVSRDPKHLISMIGVNDMIIVHARDVTMICPKNEAQRVKDLVGKVKEKYDGKYQ